MEINIFHTNDIHSNLEQTSKIYTAINKLRDVNKNSILLDVGDHIDRVRLETEGTMGLVNLKILEEMKYDIVTFGNNELLTIDKKRLEELYSTSFLNVVSSNIIGIDNKRPSWIKPWYITTINNRKIGFLATTIYYPHVYELMGWKIKDYYKSIEVGINYLKNKVDVIVLISHMGINLDRKIAERFRNIDVIIGGHTHHLLKEPEYVNTTLITAAGKFGRYLGHVRIMFKESKVSVTSTCYDAENFDEQPQIKGLIKSGYRVSSNKLSARITTIKQDLTSRADEESPISNMLSDGLRRWTGAEVGIVNSGQILDGLKNGDITKLQLHQICPHPINPVKVVLKGSSIKELLQKALDPLNINKAIRGFGFRGEVLGTLALSNMTVLYSKQKFNKIESILVNNSNLEEEKFYEVATIDMFLFSSIYSELTEAKVLSYYMPEFLRDILEWHIKKPISIGLCTRKRWIETKDTYGRNFL